MNNEASEGEKAYLSVMLWAEGRYREALIARRLFLTIYGVGGAFLLFCAVAPLERLSMGEHIMAAVGVLCCVHQFAWGWRQITFGNFLNGVAERAKHLRNEDETP